MKAFFRGSLATLVGSVALFAASTASAAGEACFNDNDCPGGGQVCGGEVCNWNKLNATPVGDKAYTCNPAGTDPKPNDGWCTGDATCKCVAEGAKCVGVHCSFTKASDAPAPSGGTSAGGSAATAGSTSTAGTATTAGTASGGSGSTPAADDGGGCSVSAPGGVNTAVALGVGLLGLGLAFARRRR